MSSISGAGSVTFSGGTVNDSGAYGISGSTLVSGGAANLIGSVSITGQATVTSGTLNLEANAATVPSLNLSGEELSPARLASSSAVHSAGPAVR